MPDRDDGRLESLVQGLENRGAIWIWEFENQSTHASSWLLPFGDPPGGLSVIVARRGSAVTLSIELGPGCPDPEKKLASLDEVLARIQS